MSYGRVKLEGFDIDGEQIFDPRHIIRANPGLGVDTGVMRCPVCWGAGRGPSTFSEAARELCRYGDLPRVLGICEECAGTGMVEHG